jgi:hypothetical protein
MGRFDSGQFYIHSTNANPLDDSKGKDLIISSHGGWAAGEGTFRPTGTRFEVQFYVFEHTSAVGEIIDAINGTVQPIDAAAGSPIKNYELSYFEHDPPDAAIAAALKGKSVHVVTIKPKVDIRLLDLLQQLHNSHFAYKRVRCLFCRYTGGDKVADARTASPGEAARLQKLNMTHDVARELHQRFGFYG